MMATALASDLAFKRHRPGEGHPERPERLDAVAKAIEGIPFTKVETRKAGWDEIARCHTRDYIRTLLRDFQVGHRMLSTGDTHISPESLDVARNAAGAVMNAVDAVMTKKAANAFCAIRPPGHHATPDRGMGFCLFNNIAVAARHAQARHGVDRVLIVDWDVHHGNGTQDIFYSDGSVLFFSTHQSPWYPGTGHPDETGEGSGKGKIINAPFAAGAGRDEILGAFRKKLLPAANEFKPGLVMISAGFDSRIDDPLGRFQLTDADFAELTQLMKEIAATHAGGRLVSVLEGGYNLAGLASASAAHAKELVKS
jgi:acetoin utilization deacetylase AcuC-like enzyme